MQPACSNSYTLKEIIVKPTGLAVENSVPCAWFPSVKTVGPMMTQRNAISCLMKTEIHWITILRSSQCTAW